MGDRTIPTLLLIVTIIVILPSLLVGLPLFFMVANILFNLFGKVIIGFILMVVVYVIILKVATKWS